VENISFVLWMVLWPIAGTFEAFVHRYLLKEESSDGIRGAASFIFLSIWIFVGTLLYKQG